MIAPCLQRIFAGLLFAAALSASASELQPGTTLRLGFRDVDGREHSTAKGYVTIITVVTRQNEAKAQAVGHRMPERVLGNPKFRYITVVNFQRKIGGAFQGLTRALIRNRLNLEADKLRPEYSAKHLQQDPRTDIFVVPDFDGAAVSSLGLAPESDAFVAFVFSGSGRLVARWNDVPSEDALGRAVSLAESRESNSPPTR